MRTAAIGLSFRAKRGIWYFPLKPRFLATLGMTLFRVSEDSGFRVMFPQYEQGWIGPDSLGLTSSSDPLIIQDWPPRYAC
jgi:hypothetical protein